MKLIFDCKAYGRVTWEPTPMLAKRLTEQKINSFKKCWAHSVELFFGVITGLSLCQKGTLKAGIVELNGALHRIISEAIQRSK